MKIQTPRRYLVILIGFLCFASFGYSQKQISRTSGTIDPAFLIMTGCSATLPSYSLILELSRSDLAFSTPIGTQVIIGNIAEQIQVSDSAFTGSQVTVSGSTITITGAFKKLQSNGCLNLSNLAANYIQVIFTTSFIQAGYFNVRAKVNSVYIGSSVEFLILPDVFTTPSLQLGNSASVTVSEVGAYTLKFTPKAPMGKFDKLVFTIVETWNPDQVIDLSCKPSVLASPTNIASSNFASASFSQDGSITTSQNLIKYSATVTSQMTVLQEYVFTFKMNNPYSMQPIVFSPLMEIRFELYYLGYPLMRTDFQTLTFSQLSPKSYACLSPVTAKLSCKSGSTYSNANCNVGSTKDVRIEITPSLFLESYSSVDVYILGLPQQTPASSSINYSDNSYQLGLTNVAVTQPSTSPITYLASFNQINPFIQNDEEYVCVDSSNYLQMNFPSISLPYDVQGLQVQFNFYTQPYKSTTGVRVTTISSRVLNTKCSDAAGYLSIPSNFLASATVSTTDSSQFEVGKTNAVHLIKLQSSFSFTSSKGLIVITFPSKSTPGSSPVCVVNLLNTLTNDSYTASTTTCTTSGSVVTVEYTFSGSNKINGYQIQISPITNSVSIEYSGEFSAKTYYNKNYLSELSPASSGTFGYYTTPAPFKAVTLATTDLNVFQTDCTYTISITPSVQMVSSDFIGITFPVHVDSIVIVSIDSASFSYSIAAPLLTLTLKATWAINSAKTITVKIRNPPVKNRDYTYSFDAYRISNSIKTSFMFTNALYGASAGYISKDFIQVVLTPKSGTNLDLNAYTLSFMPSVTLQANSNIFLTFSSTTTHSFLASSVTCSGSTTICYPNSPSANQLTISFQSALQQSIQQTVLLTSITNYLSLASVTVTLQLGYLPLQIGNEKSIKLSNSKSAKQTDGAISITDAHLGLKTTYTFSLSNFLPLPSANGFFKITAPPLITFDSTIANSVSINGQPCLTLTYDASNQSIKVNCSPNSSTVILQVLGVNNPKKLVSTSDAFSIISYETISSNDYVIKEFSSTATPLVYTNPCDTAFFCSTCSTFSSCSTCFAANTIQYSTSTSTLIETILDQSQVSRSSNSCVSSCPSGSYQATSGGIQTCQKCDSTCGTCSSSASICTSCKSSSSLYLNPLTSQCVSACPTLYYKGSANVCELCELSGNCNTCTAASVCQTCRINFYLQESSCVSTCSTGYYQSNTKCLTCPTGCSACSSATKCTSCKQDYIKYNDTCVTSCPTGQSPLILNNALTCGTCDDNCSKCITTPTTCTYCKAETYLLGTKCVKQSEIPEGSYGERNGWVVAQCMDYCKTCQFKSACDSCISSAVIYSGVCYMSCPDKAPIADGNGGCTTSSTIASVGESSRVIPFPMLLSCIAFCISVYFSKYENPQTFVPGCVVGFCSIFEWISWIILIIITFSNEGIKITTILAILGFVLVYVFNIICFIIFRRTILLDDLFIEWKTLPKNSTCFNIAFILSLIFSFKMQKIFFCKYFNQAFFKAKCKDIDLFSPFNKISILSVVLNSFLIILSAAIFGYNYQTNTQLFILSLDTLFVTLLLLLFMIWEALKKGDFFDENYNISQIGRKGKKEQEYYPFTNSYMKEAGKRSIYGHLRNGESNSNLTEFSEGNKVIQEEPLQKPMTDIMNPNEFSKNAALDRNVLQNASNGAPFVIEDEIAESSRPGQNRKYEKNHIQPIFNESEFPPIYENSQEDDDDHSDGYDDPQNSSINRMNRSFNKSTNQAINKSNLGPNASDDFYNPKNHLKGTGRNMVTSPMNQYGISPMNGTGLEGSGLSRQAPASEGSERTIFYGSNENPNQINKSGVLRVSTGVGISKAEFDGQEFHDRLYSKPSGKKGEGNFVHKGSDEMYPVDEEEAGAQEEHIVNKKGSASPKQGAGLANSRLSQAGNSQAGGAGPEATPLKQSKLGDKSPPTATAKKTGKKAGSPKQGEAQNAQKSPGNVSALKVEKNKSSLSNRKDTQNGDGENAVHRILPQIEDLDETEGANPDLNSNKNAKGKDMTFKMPNDRIDGDATKTKTNRSKVVELKNIFDSEESVHSASEAEMNFNEISPTDFNVLNQRYEDDFFNHPPPSSAQAMQQQILMSQQILSGTARSGFSVTNNNGGQKQTNRRVEGSQQVERGRSSSRVSITNNNNRQNGEASPRSSQGNGDTISMMNNTNKSNSFLAKKSVSPSNNKSKPKKGGSLQSSRISSSTANVGESKPPLNGFSGRSPTNAPSGLMHQVQNNLIVENFDEYNTTPMVGIDPYSGSKSVTGEMGVSHFNQTSGQDQFALRSAARGNNHSNSRSKINTPVGSNIVYKAPTIDASKLKSLEKIYLQRIESNLSSQQGSRKKSSNVPKKKKNGSQVSSSSNVHLNKTAQQFNPSEMQDIYFGDQNAAAGAQEVFDFEYDEDAPSANQ